MQYTEILEKNIELFRYESATIAEVNNIETKLGITFPLAIKNFLLVTGNNYCDLLNAAHASYIDALEYNQQKMKDELASRSIVLPYDYFVFCGYDENFYVKLIPGDNDPEVWSFCAQANDYGANLPDFFKEYGYSVGGFKKMDDHFSEYIKALVEERIVINNNIA
jgi:SMI1-KNR4 cell-wall